MSNRTRYCQVNAVAAYQQLLYPICLNGSQLAKMAASTKLGNYFINKEVEERYQERHMINLCFTNRE